MAEEKSDVLYLRWRSLHREKKFQYIVNGVLVWPSMLFILVIGGEFYQVSRDIITLIWEKGILLGKVIAVLLFVGAVIDNVRHNWLVKYGKVIIADIDKVYYEWHIPVLVSEKNYKNAYVLVDELVYSHRASRWERPIRILKPVREIDLTTIENGTGFTTWAKFK